MRNTTSARIFRAAIETLETRRLLACTVTVNGDVLTIKGDRFDNDITVEEVAGNIVVTCDGHSDTVTTDIDKLVIKTDKGHDSVAVELDDDIEEVIVDTSSGDDEIALQIGQPLVQRGGNSAALYGNSGGSDELDIDIYAGSGNDTIAAAITVVSGGIPVVGTVNGVPPGNDEDGPRGVEVEIDASSGDDDVAVELTYINLNDLPPALAGYGGNSGSHGGSDEDIDIEIEGGSGHDDIALDVNVFNDSGILDDSVAGFNGDEEEHDPDVIVKIDGGSGNDTINTEISVFNGLILLPDNSGQSNARHDGDGTDVNLEIRGGSGNDEINTVVNVTPFIEENGVPTLVVGLQFADVRIKIDGESGDDDINTVVNADTILDDSAAIVPSSGPYLPLHIDLEGGSGNDDITLVINLGGLPTGNANGSWKKDPYVTLEGEAGNDTLTLLVNGIVNGNSNGVPNGSSYHKPFVINGGSGFDTYFTNVPPELVKLISVEDEGNPPV